MTQRKTIGASPLDAVVPNFAEQQPKAPRPRAPRKAGAVQARALQDAVPAKPERVVKERLTVHLSVDLIDRLKNAVYWTPGLTLAGLAEGALLEAVDRLEGERGEAFVARSEPLRGGRPVK